jgi:Rrf2 family cysteine metabolism transcriptional repressor
MMAALGSECQDGPVSLKDIAARHDLPKLYLPQLTGPLKHANLLKSVWGNKGGFELARPASAISLREVFEAVDGPVSILDCVADPGACSHSSSCKCRSVWQEINDAIVSILDKYTIEDLEEAGCALADEVTVSARRREN